MSRCMRSHGVPNFPDPQFQTGPGGGFGVRIGGAGHQPELAGVPGRPEGLRQDLRWRADDRPRPAAKAGSEAGAVRPSPRAAPSARTARRPRAWPARGGRSARAVRCGVDHAAGSDSSSSSACSEASAASISRSSRSCSRALTDCGGVPRRPGRAASPASPAWRPWPLPPPGPAPRGPARTRASRRRSCAAWRPRSPPCACRPRRAARGRGRRAAASRVNSLSACSSASRLSRSRWLVGSSRISTLAPDCTRMASDRRRRSPPESTSSGFSASSPENRKRPSSAARLVRGQPGQVRGRLEHGPGGPGRELLGVLGEEAELDVVAGAELARPPDRPRRPRRRSAPGARRASRSASSCRRRWARPATRARRARATARRRRAAPGRPPTTRPSSSSNTTRPLRSGGLNENSSAAPSAGPRGQALHLRPASWPATGPGGPGSRPGTGSRTARAARSRPAGARSPGPEPARGRPSPRARRATARRRTCRGRPRARAPTCRPPRGTSGRARPGRSRRRGDARCCSSHSSDSMSRWLVGSSSSSRSGAPASARPSEARVSSPPENVSSDRSRSARIAEAEAVQRGQRPFAPAVAAGVLQPGLRLGVAPQRGLVVGAAGHRLLERRPAPPRSPPAPARRTARTRAATGRARAGAAGRAARS